MPHEIKALVIGLGRIGMGYDLYEEPRSSRIATLARAFNLHNALT